MARLIWTEPALRDLEQIADYISLEDPIAAKLDKASPTPYEIVQQQNPNHVRSSTCAYFRGARCGNSARRDLRGAHRATDVSTLIAKN